MMSLLIRQMPDHLHATLKMRARANRRSMSGEALALIEQILEDRAGPKSLEEIDRVRVRGKRPLTQEILDEARRGRP